MQSATPSNRDFRFKTSIRILHSKNLYSSEILERLPSPAVLAIAISPVPSVVASAIVTIVTVIPIAAVVPVAPVISATVVVACRQDHAAAEDGAQDRKNEKAFHRGLLCLMVSCILHVPRRRHHR